jgi:hypothetical protein
METKPKQGRIARPKLHIESNNLGALRMSPSVGDALIHPDPAPLQEIPKDDSLEVALSKVENLIGRGNYGAALREINDVKIGDTPLAGQYAFILQDKTARARIGIADRYFIRGDTANARRFYQQAIEVATTDPAVNGMAETAGKVFDTLVQRRKALINGLQESIRTNRFDQWCGQKRDLGELTVLDDAQIRAQVAPDYYLERVFGEHPPVELSPGYIDSLPLETDFIDFPSSVPGSVFRTATMQIGPNPLVADTRLRASVAMPLVANVMQAKIGLFALDAGLNATGQASDSVPLFRYEYLCDMAKQTIAHIRQIESRMLPIQFELDDFAEVVGAIRRPLEEQKAELGAVKLRINELVTQLAALAQAKKAVDEVVIALDAAQDACDCDWFCWVVSAINVFIGTIVLTAIVAALATIPILAGALLVVGATGVTLGAEYATAEYLGCNDWLSLWAADFHGAQSGLQQSINENKVELTHAIDDVFLLLKYEYAS